MCPVRVGYKRHSLTLVEGWKGGSKHFGGGVCAHIVADMLTHLTDMK